jgi:CSLREA domain-containing protein
LNDGIYSYRDAFLSIEGNLIGVASDGATPLGNGNDGVHLDNDSGFPYRAQSVTVGGLNPGDGNVIAFNQNDGIDDTSNDESGSGFNITSYAAGNVFLSNSIYANTRLGISHPYSKEFLGVPLLSDSGQDVNDTASPNDGYTNPQNYPVLNSALSSGGQTTISGHLDSAPDTGYYLQFFSNQYGTVTGYGQGQTYLGTATVTTDDNGHADFAVTFNVSVPNGQLIAATATKPFGGTSDFSPRIGAGDVLGNVFVVNSTDDTDDGAYNPAHVTLRDAILAANAHPGQDTIEFDIPGSGVQTIAPLTALPLITDPVIIDGTTQPGYAGTPLIQITGANVEQTDISGAPVNEVGLFVDSDDSTVKALDINSFDFNGPNVGTGIVMEGSNNVLVGSFIGVDSTGTVAMPNKHGGLISGFGDRIGGTTAAERNVVSGNYDAGLEVSNFNPTTGTSDGAANLIEGNFIGTDITGMQPIPNGSGQTLNEVNYGLEIGGTNIVGGAAPGAGNVISGNDGNGLFTYGAAGSVIEGNMIGTDVTGTKKLGNFGAGIYMVDFTSSVDIGLTIGGIQPGDGNIVSNNGATGIVDNDAFFDVIQGNLIGTDITGTRDFGNGIGDDDPGFGANAGIVLAGSNSLIGGPQPGAGNLISGNTGPGIYEAYIPYQPNVIQGNRIGIQADGISPLGNGSDGIYVQTGGDVFQPPIGDNVIGGLDAGDGNTIAFNGRDGVRIYAFPGSAVVPIAILSNSIDSNGSLGIDLGGDGVTPNDLLDADSGANDLQNFPVLATVGSNGTISTVTGTFNSTPNTFFTLQFFVNSAADPTGYGEGQTLLGTRYLTTDSNGNATFSFNFYTAVAPGQFVTATATSPSSDTSEFSKAITWSTSTVAANQAPTVSVGGPYTINEGDSLTLDGSHTSDPDGDPLTYSWDINGDGVFTDATGATPTLTWAQLNALGIVNGPSSFTVQLRVDDGQGHVVTSAATTLSVLNVTPVADAGPDQYVNVEDTVSLTGTFTDPGTFDTHTLSWHVDADNGQVIADGSGADFSFVPDDAGTYTVTFSVTDSDGATGTAVVYVYAYDVPPTATIVGLPAQSTVGVPINLTSQVSDISPVVAAAGYYYYWDAYAQDNNDYFYNADPTDPNFSFTPTGTGTYGVELYVEDKNGGNAYVFQSFVVVSGTGTDTPPVVTMPAGATINEGDTYTGSGSFVDPDPGDSWTATVDYGDGSGSQPLTLNPDQTFNLSHVYADNGGYDIAVTVTDSAAMSDTETTHVTVNNVSPAVTLASPSPVAVDAVFSLAGSFTDPGDDTWTAMVNYGDGTGDLPLALAADKTFALSHTYQSAGNFNVAVTVTDDDGGSGTTTVTEVVNKLQTSLTAAPASATYGGTTSLSATLTAGGSPSSGKTLTFSLNGVPVGTGITNGSGVATLSNVSIGSLHAGSATISVSFAEDTLDLGVTSTATLSIAKASLVVTPDGKSKAYGAALPTLTASYAGFVNEDTPASLTTLPTLSTTATAASHVGSYPITASAAVDPDYSITYQPGSLSVTPVSLIITADSKTKVYGAALPTLTTSYAGFVNGDGSSSLTTQPHLTSTAIAASHVDGGPYTITASGAVDADYTISYVPGNLVITAAPLTITADNKSKVYGAALPTLTASYSGFVNGDGATSLTKAPTLTTTATAASHVNAYSVTVSGAVDDDYSISYVAGTLSVTPAALTITADNKSKVYGAALPTLTASYAGLVNGDTSASLTKQPALTTTAAAASHVNTYSVSASGAVDSDYSINYVAGTLSVTPAGLTITSDNKSKVYGAALPALTASYAGLVNGDTSASLTAQPTLATTATAASHVNSYPITASGAVDGDYSISYIAGTLSVTPASLTITADNKSKGYGAALPTLTASYAGLVNGDASASLTKLPALSTTVTATSHVSSYPITASGAVDGDYSISYVAGTLAVTPAALTISADNKSKIYGAALPTLTASYAGLVNGDTSASLTKLSALSTTATATSAVGSYSISASGASDADYSITYQSGSLSVTPAPLTITADNKTKVAGTANPPLTFTPSGFVNGDTASSLTTQPTLTTTATPSSPVGSYPITASGAANPNYTITYVAGTLTVAAASTGSITGKDYFDVTGNGLTSDDTPLAGVKVYIDTNNDGSWTSGEPYATTLSDGSFSLTGLAAGTYTVREVVPTGDVRTAPATSDHYTITLGSGQTSSGNNFDNAQLGNTSVLSNIAYLVNGANAVSDLRGATQEGSTIEVSFTVGAGTQPQRLTLVSYTAPSASFGSTTASQQMIFDTDTGVFGPGSYTLSVTNPHSYFQVDFVSGNAIDHLGASTSNIFYSSQNRLFSADNGGAHAVLASPASLTGNVYLDSNNNGIIDSGERPIAGVTVTATCGSTSESSVTDMYGVYRFDNLAAGAYTITESQPAGYSDGKDTLGNKGGTASNDKFSSINLTAGTAASGYNFGEQQTVGSTYAANQTQSSAWWNGSSGQALIKALNGSQNPTNLGNWLATNFNNLFGANAGSANNMAAKTNAQVAAYFQSLYANSSKKPETDALTLALNTYVTNSSLAGNTATSYGFAVSTSGLGIATVNVGTDGAAFGINDNTVMTITELLSRVNARSRNGMLWDSNGDGSLNSAETILRNQVYSLFDTINST